MTHLVRKFGGVQFVRHTGWMTGGFAMKAALQAAYFVIVARALGVSGLGAFAAALAIVSILAPFSGLGAGNIVVMRTARRVELFAEQFGTGLVAIVLTGGLLAGAAVVFGDAIFPGSAIAAALPWVAAAELGAGRVTDLVTHCYQAHERPRAAALTVLADSGSRALAAVLFVAVGARADASVWAAWYFVASALAAAAVLAFCSRQLGRPRFARESARAIARHGLFYSIGSASQTIYADIDKTMLARFDSVSIAGFYTGAYRLVAFLTTPIIAFVYVANPWFFRTGERDPGAVWDLVQRSRRYVVLYGASTAVLCFLAVPVIVPAILGGSFRHSGDIVRWLALLPLIQGIHVLYGNALMGVGRQPLRSAIQAGTAAINAGLNVWLITSYSWRGAVIATLLSEGLLAVAMVVLLRQATRADSGVSREGHSLGPQTSITTRA